MVKLTVLYNHPASPDAFESYYSDKHFPIVLKMGGLVRLEATTFTPGPDGSKPAYYRMGSCGLRLRPICRPHWGRPRGRLR